MIVPFIQAADDAALQKAQGYTLVKADGIPENVLVESLRPDDLVSRLKLNLPDGEGQGRDGLLDMVQKILQYSVNTWDQGFLDKLYATNTPVRASNLI